MNSLKLHIVSFDVPYPPDYGGAMDVFYRLKALSEAGVQIILHCFDYGRGQHQELEKYAQKVFYYKRHSKWLKATSKTPMIIASRANEELLQNLVNQEGAILFEGQHTTAFIQHPALKNRKKFVRIHNVEHVYYNELAKAENSFFRKTFFKQEAKKLMEQEFSLSASDVLFCITDKEQAYYSQKGFKTERLEVSFPLDFLFASQKKEFSLFHGNLSVPENEKVALWLMDKIAPQLNHPLLIVGKNPTSRLKKKSAKRDNVKLIENPSRLEMEQLLKEAKAHIMWTFQNTGVKLKLLHALTTNSVVIANDIMLEGTSLSSLCEIVNTPEELTPLLNKTLPIPIQEKEIASRKTLLQNHFGPQQTANKIIKYL